MMAVCQSGEYKVPVIIGRINIIFIRPISNTLNQEIPNCFICVNLRHLRINQDDGLIFSLILAALPRRLRM